MCLDVKVGLLEKREDWQEELRELFASDKEQEYVSAHATGSCFTKVGWRYPIFSIFNKAMKLQMWA